MGCCCHCLFLLGYPHSKKPNSNKFCICPIYKIMVNDKKTQFRQEEEHVAGREPASFKLLFLYHIISCQGEFVLSSCFYYFDINIDVDMFLTSNPSIFQGTASFIGRCVRVSNVPRLTISIVTSYCLSGYPDGVVLHH